MSEEPNREGATSERVAFAFRPWVRRSCRKAMVWGVGVVALLGGVAWIFKTPGSAPLGRAFGVLLFYGVLFWLTLLQDLVDGWQAGRGGGINFLSYQPLHTFRGAGFPMLACSPVRLARRQNHCASCTRRSPGRAVSSS